jgi:hypothetical protein
MGPGGRVISRLNRCRQFVWLRVRLPQEHDVECYLPAMSRLIALIIASSTVLASCSGSGGIVGDYLPEWAGGYPKGLPPRPGTPEYDAFRKKQEEDAAREKQRCAEDGHRKEGSAAIGAKGRLCARRYPAR